MKPLSLIEKAFFLKKVKIFVDLDLDLLRCFVNVAEQGGFTAAGQAGPWLMSLQFWITTS